MKIVAVLKSPNIDVVADVDAKYLSDYCNGGRDGCSDPIMKNICVVTWMGEYVKIIPFSVARDLKINMPFDNISMMFEADAKIGNAHDEKLSEERINPTKLLTYKEHVEKLEKKNKELEKTLSQKSNN